MNLNFEKGVKAEFAGNNPEEAQEKLDAYQAGDGDRLKEADLFAKISISNWFEALDQSDLSEADKIIIIKALVKDSDKFFSGEYKYFSDTSSQDKIRNEKFNTLIKNSIQKRFENWAKEHKIEADANEVLQDALEGLVNLGESQLSSRSLRMVTEMIKAKEKAKRESQGEDLLTSSVKK